MTGRSALKTVSPADVEPASAGTSEVLVGIGAVSARLGVTVRAVRHYERQGLIRPLRNDNDYRVYGREEWVRLELIVLLRSAGIGLAQIRRALDHEGAAPAHAIDLLEGQATQLEAQIGHVRALRQQLIAQQDAKRWTSGSPASGRSKPHRVVSTRRASGS